MKRKLLTDQGKSKQVSTKGWPEQRPEAKGRACRGNALLFASDFKMAVDIFPSARRRGLDVAAPFSLNLAASRAFPNGAFIAAMLETKEQATSRACSGGGNERMRCIFFRWSELA